jgi:hypothetical protein
VWAWKVAERYASEHLECKTVGILLEEAGFGDLTSEQMSEASQVYVEESSSIVHGFFGDKFSPDSDWIKYECIAVIKNPKLNSKVKRFNLVPEQIERVQYHIDDKHNLPRSK